MTKKSVWKAKAKRFKRERKFESRAVSRQASRIGDLEDNADALAETLAKVLTLPMTPGLKCRIHDTLGNTGYRPDGTLRDDEEDYEAVDEEAEDEGIDARASLELLSGRIRDARSVVGRWKAGAINADTAKAEFEKWFDSSISAEQIAGGSIDTPLIVAGDITRGIRTASSITLAGKPLPDDATLILVRAPTLEPEEVRTGDMHG